jgi:hypothetical protein
MRTDFSPTAEAARRLAARGTQAPTTPAPVPAPTERWCEWPRRAPVTRRIMGIWQTLQAIQARHA